MKKFIFIIGTICFIIGTIFMVACSDNPGTKEGGPSPYIESCSDKSNTNEPDASAQNTKKKFSPAYSTDLIPDAIKKNIWYGEEDIDFCKVLIIVQGGPTYELDSDPFLEQFKAEGINTDDLLLVMPHQHQTIEANHALYGYPGATASLPFETIESYSDKTIDILDKTTKYFTNAGYETYILGISSGAFILERYISTKGLDPAIKYLIMVGRLDMPNEFWMAYKEGKRGGFIDGITPVTEEEEDIDLQNLWKISASFGQYRYTEELDKYEDLSNVTYLYAEKDEAVGRLTEDELAFLARKKVQVIKADIGSDTPVESYHVAAIVLTLKSSIEKAFGIK